MLAEEMPPKNKPRPSKEELDVVINWLTAGLVQASTTANMVAATPELGNRINHDLLFRIGGEKVPASSPARLWRVSSDIYNQFLVDMNPGMEGAGIPGRRVHARYSQPFATAFGDGFRDFSGDFTIDEQTASLLMQNARCLAEFQTQVDSSGKVVGPGGPYRKYKQPALLAIADPHDPRRSQSLLCGGRKRNGIMKSRNCISIE